MYLPKSAPKNRLREAQKARDNRAEIVRALSTGEVTAARSLQNGHLHRHRRPGAEERPQPVRQQRLWRHPDRHAAEPAVRRAALHPAVPPAEPATPTSRSTDRMSTGRTKRNSRRRSSSAQRPSARPGTKNSTPRAAATPILRQSADRPRPRAKAARRDPISPISAGTNISPRSGYVMSLGQIAPARASIPNFPRQRRTRSGPSASAVSARAAFCRRPLIKIRYGEPALTRIYQQPAGRPDAEWRLRPQRVRLAQPQRP